MIFNLIKHAKELLFDKTGTKLQATNTQDAIVELDDKLANKVDTNDSRLSDARTPKSHTHDDRYYTESEINTKLDGKLNKASYGNIGISAGQTKTILTMASNSIYLVNMAILNNQDYGVSFMCGNIGGTWANVTGADAGLNGSISISGNNVNFKSSYGNWYYYTIIKIY